MDKKNINDNNIQKKRKSTIHTTISNKVNEILKKYVEFKDENDEIIFGSKSRVIEKALELLEQHYYPLLADSQKIWCRARDELNMVIVGKTTFLSYIKGEVEDAYLNNIAIEVIEWYLGKRKEEMDLEEFLNGLKSMWIIANYFFKIELEKNEENAFQMIFHHHLTKEYSSYWANYFKIILKANWNCTIENFIRNESFQMVIKENKPKK